MKINQLTGNSDEQIHYLDTRVGIHKDMVSAYDVLRNDAQQAGFDLRIASGFRDFDRQKRIWNCKLRGELPTFDSEGNALDLAQMPDVEKVYAVLRWSALPGASRHHWGTDIDVFDAGVMADSKSLKLVPEEYSSLGKFARFNVWLDQYLALTTGLFFRPYGKDLGGVACEPWHLSYRPLADHFQSLLTQERLQKVVQSADIDLKEVVLAEFDSIFERFVCNVSYF